MYHLYHIKINKKNLVQISKKITYTSMNNKLKKKRLTKLEWKVISFAISTLESNAGDDLNCFGKDAEKMKEALESAHEKVAGRSL